MKKTNQQIIIFTLTIIAICFLSVIIFTFPAFYEQLNLTSKSNIGGAIGGITAPIIGIITAILLYLALTRQVESNQDQRLRNESDIIFLLINQLEKELSTFYYKFKRGNEEFKYYGAEAVNDFANEFKHTYRLKDFNFTFKEFFEANQFILLIRSFQLIEKRIDLTNLSAELKHLFQNKLAAFYECRLRDPISNVIEAINQNEHLKDEVTAEIESFLKSKQ